MDFRLVLGWLALGLPPLMILAPPAGCAGDELPVDDTHGEDGERGAAQSPLDAPPLWVANYGYDAGGWRIGRHLRYLADVDGDGRADVVGFGNDGVVVSLSTGTAFTEPSLWISSYGYSAGGWRVDRHPRLLADVDGDGKADIVGFGNEGVYVSLSTGTRFGPPELWVGSYGYDAGGWRSDRNPRLLADVDGDGKLDVVGFGNAGVYVSRSMGTRFTEPELWVADYGYDAGGWRVERHPRTLADVNGDGRLDVVGFGGAGVYVSLSTGTSFQTPSLWVADYAYYAGGYRVDRHPRVMADVDGDGNADVVGFGDAGVYVSRSNGSSFSAPALWVADFGFVSGGWRADRHPRMVADINGDGRADVVGFGDAGAYLALSTGSSFTKALLVINNFGYVVGEYRVERHPRLLGDVNGDGRLDLVGFSDVGVVVKTD